MSVYRKCSVFINILPCHWYIKQMIYTDENKSVISKCHQYDYY